MSNTLDELRARHADAVGKLSDCELIQLLAEKTGQTPSFVAAQVGIDSRAYKNGADCRPELVKVATDPWVWVGVATVVIGSLLYRKFRMQIMSLKDEIAQLPIHKKVVGVGGFLFLLACLFPPFNQVSTYSTRPSTQRFDGFHFLFDLPTYGQYELAWSILAVELIAIVVVSGVAVFLLKRD